MVQKFCACGDCESEDIIPEPGLAVMCDHCTKYGCEEGQLSCNYQDSDQAQFDRNERRFERQMMDELTREIDCGESEEL